MNSFRRYNYLLAKFTMKICIIVGGIFNFFVNWIKEIPLFPIKRGLLILFLFTILGFVLVIIQYVGYFLKIGQSKSNDK
jgi:hypothetical protein